MVRGARALLYAWDGVRSFHRLDVDPAELTDAFAADDPDVIALWAEMDDYVGDVRRTWRHLDDPVAAGP